MASIHAQKNRAGNTYRVLWRQDGRQRSLTFENLPAAERFKTLLEDHGPDEALRIIELDEIGRHVPTVTEWLHTHIDNLTGVQPATIARYRTCVARDIDSVFGAVPVSAVTETTIAKWVKQLGGSGKTIANKHGFLSGAFNAAVRAGVMAYNPCQGRRLPHTHVDETVFLTPEEFRAASRSHRARAVEKTGHLVGDPRVCASLKPPHSPRQTSTSTPELAESRRYGSTRATTDLRLAHRRRGSPTEGPTMLTNIVGVDPEGVAIGLPVRVEFSRTGGPQDPALPRFRPAATVD